MLLIAEALENNFASNHWLALVTVTVYLVAVWRIVLWEVQAEEKFHELLSCYS